MHSKRHCIKWAARVQNRAVDVESEEPNTRRPAEQEQSQQLQQSGKLGKAQDMRHKTAAAG